MTNPTPAPNELGSRPACAERDGAAAGEKPGGQRGQGAHVCWGPIPVCPHGQVSRITAVSVGQGAKSQAETPPKLGIAGGTAEPSLVQIRNGAHMQGTSFGPSLPAGNSPAASQRSRLMGSGCFPRRARPDIPGRPHLPPASPFLGPLSSRFPAGPTPAGHRWGTDTADTPNSSSSPQKHRPVPGWGTGESSTQQLLLGWDRSTPRSQRSPAWVGKPSWALSSFIWRLVALTLP